MRQANAYVRDEFRSSGKGLSHRDRGTVSERVECGDTGIESPRSGPAADHIIGDVLEDFFCLTFGEYPKRLFGPHGMGARAVIRVFDSAGTHHDVSDFTYVFFGNFLGN